MKDKMYITMQDLQIAWLMFKDWLARVFGSKSGYPLAPGFQEGFVK